MTHLTDGEIVDLIDGTLAPARAAHLDACDDCRTSADGLRDMLARTADVEIPEPSPLFWEHFSARVHEDVRSADAVEPSRWFGWADGPTVKWAMAGAFLTLLLVSGLWVSIWRSSAAVSERVSPERMAARSGAEPEWAPGADAFDPETPDSDEAWALVRTVADDVKWDEASWDDAAAQGLGVRPGSVELALVALTGDARSELLRLLQAETKQPGA